MSFSHIHISQFSIEASSTRFYANTNHQCHVRVKILKQGINSNTGMMARIPLTIEERNSVSTAVLSSSLDYNALPMPQGWNVTSSRNKYELGLINQSMLSNLISWSPHSEEQFDEEFKNTPCYDANEMLDVHANITDSNENIESLQGNNVPEIIDLFVSASTTGVRTIIAKAQVEVSVGDDIRNITITTNMNEGNNIFNSRINLEGILPFAIAPNMLSNSFQTIQDRREYVTKWDVHHQLITLSRWTLPFNLRISDYVSGDSNTIFYRLGNDHQSNRFLTSGRFYRSGHSTVNARDAVTGGCVWDHSYSVHVPNNQMVVSVLHITGCSWTSPSRTGTHTVAFIDNFGNQHSFIFSPEDTGRRIAINRAD